MKRHSYFFSAAAIAGMALAGAMLSAGTAKAATCGAGSGDYSYSGYSYTDAGGNLYCGYNAANNATVDSFSAAQTFAVSLGGNLASVDNSTVLGQLSSNIVANLSNPYPNDFGQTPAGPLAWIGLSATNTNFGFHQVTAADFSWVNGDTSTYWDAGSLWSSGTAGNTGQQDGCASSGSCQALYAFLNENGSLGSFGSITYDNPSLLIDAIVEFAGGETVTTPLPAALPLFAGGLGAMGLLGWRRKRKATAIAA
jgi:hypothetical protein